MKPLQNAIWKLGNEAFLRDFLQNCEVKAWLKTSLFFETSLNIAIWRLENEAVLFLRASDRKVKAQKKKAFSARLLEKWNLQAQKTMLFCKNSFKNVNWKVSNEKRNFSARRPSKWQVGRNSRVRTPVRIGQFDAALEKYCAWPLGTKILAEACCHAKWSLKSNTSGAQNLPPFPSSPWIAKSLSLRGDTQCLLRISTSKWRSQSLTILISEPLPRYNLAQFLRHLGSRSSTPPRSSRLAFRCCWRVKLLENTMHLAISTRQNCLLSCICAVTSLVYSRLR